MFKNKYGEDDGIIKSKVFKKPLTWTFQFSFWGTQMNDLMTLMSKQVDPPVGLYDPTPLLTHHNLLQEVLSGLRLAHFHLEHLPQVTHVLCGAQLRDAGEQHEGEKGDQ